MESSKHRNIIFFAALALSLSSCSKKDKDEAGADGSPAIRSYSVEKANPSDFGVKAEGVRLPRHIIEAPYESISNYEIRECIENKCEEKHSFLVDCSPDSCSFRVRNDDDEFVQPSVHQIQLETNSQENFRKVKFIQNDFYPKGMSETKVHFKAKAIRGEDHSEEKEAILPL